MRLDLVSIITPSYNCAQFVEETIRSIQAQTYSNWELLFQDDCSTDGTQQIVERFAANDERIKYECNPQNSGAAITRNNALKRAKGVWIAFLDSDDLWMPEKLEKQIAFMKENDYHFSYTNYCEINEKSEEVGKCISGPWRVSMYGMFCYNWMGCLTVMYNHRHIGFLQIDDVKKNNDYAMWLKVCRIADCYLLDDTLAKYRRGRLGSLRTHGYTSLVKWHYKLFKDVEKLNVINSLLLTLLGMICGVYKKIKYTKKYKVSI